MKIRGAGILTIGGVGAISLATLLALRAGRAVDHTQGAAPPVADSSERAWRAWFAGRGYGEDPYLFISDSDRGASDCGTGERLVLVAVDSTAVHLAPDGGEDARREGTVCRVRFADLAGRPAQAELAPGRLMWRLTLQRSPEAINDTNPNGGSRESPR